LGGRWYYDPRGTDAEHAKSDARGSVPKRFDASNADRLYYRTDRFEAPFADNMQAWLQKGWLDLDGQLVTKDRLVKDNVALEFTNSDLIVRSHNLPNHPTAVFPDRWRLLDGNPNFIQEQRQVWRIPLEPRVNPRHVAVDPHNENGALPGGPIGVACNGVIFFNPFDADSVEAIWRLDRCCGHPSPGFEYHYHKYPVCVKSPWADDGTAHSPLIGFAFDGFPIYGPYEAAGELAKDSTKNPLNEFNVHYDEARGWHYHVTPGKFPHLIGGYWGVAHVRNRAPRPRRGPPE
ncbi:MAG TPA: YHYH protein, partial [Planctomycetaceae bacterium]|nr:YHYH protein [Planctomycetaceae bacterium]